MLASLPHSPPMCCLAGIPERGAGKRSPSPLPPPPQVRGWLCSCVSRAILCDRDGEWRINRPWVLRGQLYLRQRPRARAATIPRPDRGQACRTRAHRHPPWPLRPTLQQRGNAAAKVRAVAAPPPPSRNLPLRLSRGLSRGLSRYSRFSPLCVSSFCLFLSLLCPSRPPSPPHIRPPVHSLFLSAPATAADIP